MQTVSVRACARCGEQMALGAGVCDACGAVAQVRHFDSLSALDVFRQDLRARGINPDTVVHGRHPWAVGAMSVMGSVFLVAGFVSILYVTRSGLGAASFANLASAVVPIAWGTAFLVLARKVAGRGRTP